MSDHGKHPLHGLTVVVETSGPVLYVGRFHSESDEGILLRDVDVRELASGADRERHLARSARLGVFKNTDRVLVPRSEVASVRRLIEFAATE